MCVCVSYYLPIGNKASCEVRDEEGEVESENLKEKELDSNKGKENVAPHKKMKRKLVPKVKKHQQ